LGNLVDREPIGPNKILQTINRQHGTDLRLGERFAGGEQGAYAIVDETGTRSVLKWHLGDSYVEQFRNARTITEHLAARGYPVPHYEYAGEADGAAYTIQSLLPGSPMGTLDARFLPDLLRLNDLQAGPAPVHSRYWQGLIVSSVLHGFQEYCVIETLRRHSSETRELLDRLQETVKTLADTECPVDDIVHFDFTQANILIKEGEISGVIDWDGTMAGDRAFDLATLLFYAVDQPDLRQTLWRHASERSSPDAIRLYLAHLIVRQVDWSIRFHGPAGAAYSIHQAAEIHAQFM
jgi:hypothetical protein